MALNDQAQALSHCFLVYGPTGSGLSEALKVFRSHGYLSIAGMPLSSVDQYLMMAETDNKCIAFCPEIDPYEITADAARAMLEQVKEKHAGRVKLLYLSTATDKLIARHVDSGHRHVYEKHSLRDVIEQEQLLYQNLKGLSDYHIDTSTTTESELALKIAKLIGVQTEAPPLEINLVSFGFKKGAPSEAELVFDMRFLPNPFYIEDLRPMTGMDKPVADYVMSFEEAQTFLNHWKNLLTHILPLYQGQGKVRMTIGIGCTGGQHRSVAMTEAIAKHLMETFPHYTVRVIHREQSHWPQKKTTNAASIN